MLSLALTSDLHLEVRDVAIDAVVSPDLHADVLLLLGDVGDPADDRWMRFMEGVSARFPVVLLLSGNNEYRSSSGRTMADTDALIRQRLAPLRNVHYLSNGVFQIKDVVFIGTTLWSFLPDDPITPGEAAVAGAVGPLSPPNGAVSPASLQLQPQSLHQALAGGLLLQPQPAATLRSRFAAAFGGGTTAAAVHHHHHGLRPVVSLARLSDRQASFSAKSQPSSSGVGGGGSGGSAAPNGTLLSPAASRVMMASVDVPSRTASPRTAEMFFEGPLLPSSSSSDAPPRRSLPGDGEAAPADAEAAPQTKRDFIAATSQDYRQIHVAPGQLLTPDDTNALFQSNVAFLMQAVAAARAAGLRPVVLTHHAPTLRGTSHPRFAGHPATHAYATDLEPLLAGSGIAAWFCGHTHHNFDMLLAGGEVRLASNQYGSGRHPAQGYSTTWVTHLPTRGVAAGSRATRAERAGSLGGLLARSPTEVPAGGSTLRGPAE